MNGARERTEGRNGRMKEIRMSREAYGRLLSGEACAVVRESVCGVEAGDVARIVAVDEFGGSGAVSAEAWRVLARRDCVEEEGLRIGFCLLSLRREPSPGRAALSQRARNVLRRWNITDELLAGMDYEDLIGIRACGKKTAREILRYRDSLSGSRGRA